MDSPKEFRRQLIGEILVEMDCIKSEQLSAALVRQSQSHASRLEFR